MNLQNLLTWVLGLVLNRIPEGWITSLGILALGVLAVLKIYHPWGMTDSQILEISLIVSALTHVGVVRKDALKPDAPQG